MKLRAPYTEKQVDAEPDYRERHRMIGQNIDHYLTISGRALVLSIGASLVSITFILGGAVGLW